MRKRNGAMAFVIIVIIFIIGYYISPIFKGFVDDNTALATFLGGLLTIFLSWYFSREPKKTLKEESKEISKKEPEEISKKDMEIKIEAILSPVSGLCLGRENELSILSKDINQKNILVIKGIPGIGKTTLGLKFKDILEEKGYNTFWFEFDFGSYERFLSELSTYLKDQGSVYASYLITQTIPLEKRMKIAVQELCEYPTVIFLDDLQNLDDDSHFKVFKRYLRNSKLVIISRKQPTFISEKSEGLSSLDKDISVQMLRELGLHQPEVILEKIHEKTQGHPWLLVRFAELANINILPVERLLKDIPDFGEDQQTYINEQCWQHLNRNEKDLLMMASVFTKPLPFDALTVCTKGRLSNVLFSLARKFYMEKRGKYYYIPQL
ncbi:MAG: hypothetical protein PVF58_10645 [Candidatus Methanofastidiosia archaeon]|jgi:hypothetical protein